MDTPFAPVEVFYSSAEVDAPLLEQLEHHLSVVRHEGQITTWHRRQIAAGSDWLVELDQHLNTASLILLLISPDFLASNYQYGAELQRAMQRHDNHEARVIPIALRACDWEGAPFSKLQVIPRNGKAITSWHNRDEAFAEIAREIREALEVVHRFTVSPPSLALPKIWQIPYQRNPVFTGRNDLLQILTEILGTDHSAMLSQPEAISGLGGIGKTQLAVEYAYRAASKYQAVFWIAAETREMLVSGYAGLAMTLNLPEKDEPDQHVIVQAVQQWLQTHTDWLLILDNADDLSLVQPLLPPVFGGHIILTTRTQATGRFAHRIEIDILERDDSALLLLRRAGMLSVQGLLENAGEQEVALAYSISEELGDLPLALDQAGAYIEETKCGLLGYQHRYQARRAALLQWRGTLTTDHPAPVATTWSLSFEKVAQRNPATAEFLQLCAFLHADAIPEEIITQGAMHLGLVLQPVAEDPVALDEVIAALSAYSLVQRNVGEHTVNIHRLVQAVLIEGMEKETRHLWEARTVRAMNEVFPEGTFATWHQCERYLSHSLACTAFIEQEHITIPETIALLGRAGWYLVERARYTEAEPILRQALATSEQLFGPTHLTTATSLNNLAELYWRQGKYIPAEQLVQQALVIRESELGRTHIDTAHSLNDLAVLYEAQGRYGEAEPLYMRVLAIHEQQLGAQHPDTAISLNNLALLYHNQEKYEQAEPLYMRALAIKEQQLGAQHPSTALSLNNLASLYKSLGKYAQAELLYVRALAIREQQLGAQHPDTAISLNNLASLYDKQGKYSQAEPLYVRALTILESTLGQNHPNTQTVRSHHTALLQAMEHEKKRRGWKRMLHFFSRW